MKTALILSGGGARAAYQIGVLKAVSELLPDKGKSPFDIICGTSSGALNAAKLACAADNFPAAVHTLEQLWSQLTSNQVHHVGYREVLVSIFKLIGSFFHSGIAHGRPLALLDNTPLAEMLSQHVDFERLGSMIDQEYLHALSITALGYSSGQSLCFFQGSESISPWSSAKRLGIRCQVDYKHIMASLALPGIFPAVRINREYFGDGALRQTAPMSAALHLGADKLFVIGVSGNGRQLYERKKTSHSPSLAQVFGQLINSAFIDAQEEDVEMLRRFNEFAKCMTDDQRQQLNVCPVELLIIEPSVKFDDL